MRHELVYDGNGGVFVVGSDGRGLRRVGPGRQPSWLGDGLIAVLADDPTVVDPQGRSLRRLPLGPPTRGRKRYDHPVTHWLVASSDGKRLAFSRALQTPAEEPPRELGIIDTDGSDQRTLVLAPQTALGGPEDPAFSPDGQTIVYVFDQRAIETVRIDGSKRRVLYDKGVLHSPRWSPDGRVIAFVVEDQNGNGRVFVMRPDGRRIREVGPGDCPEWTPDGRALLVLPARGGRVAILGLDGKPGGTLPTGDAICPRIRPS